MKKPHHANIVLGSSDIRQAVFEILKRDLDFEVSRNPDFLVLENESFGIDDARSLSTWAIGKPLVGEVKVALVISRAITLEAQNALLKIMEEPSLGTYFFIGLENLGGLLETFISRTQVLDVGSDLTGAKNKKSLADEFLTADVSGKLSIIRKLEKSKNKTDLKDLIKDLEMAASVGAVSYENKRDILKSKILVSARGSSPRVLLEWLSCVL